MHIREFEEVVAIFHDQFGTTDTIRIKLFPFAPKDRAKSWLYSLRPRSIGFVILKYTVLYSDDSRSSVV